MRGVDICLSPHFPTPVDAGQVSGGQVNFSNLHLWFASPGTQTECHLNVLLVLKNRNKLKL